jgi:hypothetical protein
MKRVVLILLSIIVILFLIWGVDRAVGAGCNPAALGGTGTCTVPSTGELPIGNGSGSYTPATLTPGANIVITNASGSVTIGVTGTATGTVYLLQAGHGISLSPASITSSGTIAVNTSTVIADVVASGEFLPSSTTYVATVNGESGAVTIGIPATTTVNGTQATVFHLIGDGTTVTSTVNGATTTFSVVTTGNWAGTWQGVNSSTFYKASNPSGYISGNQTITFVAEGDATGTATGTTMISDTMTVTGLEGKALPALATGTLKYSGGAWTFDGNTYLPSGINVTTTGPLGGGGPLTTAGLTLTCATCLTGNQTITLTGAVTGSGTTSIATAYATSTLYALFSGTGPITFNASTGAIGWTNSLNYITGVAVNGQSGTSFSIVAGSGLSSSISGTTTTLSLNLSAGCTGGNFVQTISATGTITCAIPSGTFTTTTVNGTAALAFILQGDGSTITSTTSGATTTYSVIPGVYLTPASGTAMFYPLNSNPAGYITSTPPKTVYLASTTPWTIGGIVIASTTGAVTTIPSTTYYLATNPSGFTTTTVQAALNALSAAGCLTYSTSTGQFTATCLSTSTAATTYVPYTGAGGNVNLGANSITATNGGFSGTGVFGTTTQPSSDGALELYTAATFPGDVGINIHNDTQNNHVSFQLESGTSTQTKWQFSQRGNASFAFYNYYNGSWIDPFTITDGPNGAVGFGGSVNETTLAGATLIANSSTVAIKDSPNANTLHVNGTADFITSASVGTSTQNGTFYAVGTSSFIGNVGIGGSATSAAKLYVYGGNIEVNQDGNVNDGVLIGDLGSTYPGIWFGGNATSASYYNYSFLWDPVKGTLLNAPAGVNGITFRIANSSVAGINANGMEIGGGDITTSTPPAGVSLRTYGGIQDSSYLSVGTTVTTTATLNVAGTLNVSQTSTLATTTATTLTVANTGTATTTVIEGTASSTVCHVMYGGGAASSFQVIAGFSYFYSTSNCQ